MYAGPDGVIHVAGEYTNAAPAVPRAIMSNMFIRFITAFAFIITMAYSISDFKAVLATTTGYGFFID